MMKIPWIAKWCLVENYYFRVQFENLQVMENLSPDITLEGRLLSLFLLLLSIHTHICMCMYVYVHM